ncbi:unnamed protein product [Colias eurytheme]|nr:unnamed protein product [Colias eurytheme]
MVFKKCFKCNKSITRKSPGLECSRCEKTVHAQTECANLTNKQIQALRATAGLEWSCDECQNHTPRRSSFFVPCEEDDNPHALAASHSHLDIQSSPGNVAIDMKKLIHDMSAQMEKLLKKEIEPLQHTLTFISDELSDTVEKLTENANKMKALEKKNEYLTNQNKGLELRVKALEQRLNEIDQNKLCNSLEVSGVPVCREYTDKSLIENLGEKIKANKECIRTIRRLPGRPQRPSVILVELKSQSDRDNWISAGRDSKLKVSDLNIRGSTDNPDNPIYFREALTSQTKTLLYNAKQRLRESYKYIWCKEGRILARKSDNCKVSVIRCVNDIDSLLNDK